MKQFQRKTIHFFGIALIFIFSIAPQSSYAFQAYSNDELDELEHSYQEIINQSPAIDRTPLTVYYLNRLGQSIARNTTHPAPDFFLVRSNEINAFAGPGGHIGVNAPLIRICDTEDELAAVLAHEIAHVKLHHLYHNIEHQKHMQVPMLAAALASIALGAVNPSLGSGALMASLSGFSQSELNFTRANEQSADHAGEKLLAAAGYPPMGMVNFLKKLQMQSRYYALDDIPAILRTHPLDNDRISEALNRMPKKISSQKISSEDFYYIRALVNVENTNNPKLTLDEYTKPCSPAKQIYCIYGRALILMKMYRFEAAAQQLKPYYQSHPTNLFLGLALVDAYSEIKQFKEANNILTTLTNQHNDIYPLVIAKANLWLLEAKPHKAISLLLHQFRTHPRDIPICHLLAKAESAAKQKGYAYLIQAECDLLQGHPKKAKKSLAVAKTLSGTDKLLEERIHALYLTMK